MIPTVACILILSVFLFVIFSYVRALNEVRQILKDTIDGPVQRLIDSYADDSWYQKASKELDEWREKRRFNR
ncbi:hypothetical protein SAMN06264849_11416 [Melghirimyces algeriensis]|uniref:Uncharacterized protein n=1 Tax=Melghirimyces algeriensis TaxID=910412 RepID=A0A521F7A5_9BACL|nr:hypothetical protein SAMN06264849_11416 [Melghirimyces algeriensis]